MRDKWSKPFSCPGVLDGECFQTPGQAARTQG